MFDMTQDPQFKANSEFHSACIRGDLEAAERHLAEGADINVTRSDMPALLMAASEQHWHVVRALVEKGAEVNCKNRHGWTPIHIVAQHGHEDLVQLMIDNAALFNRKDNHGETPLYVAAKAGKREVCFKLMKQGGDPRVGNDQRDTPMHCAARLGDSELLQAMSEKGAMAHAENDAGETPISVAADDSLRSMLEQLELARSLKVSADARAPEPVAEGEGAAPTTAQPTRRRILKA